MRLNPALDAEIKRDASERISAIRDAHNEALAAIKLALLHLRNAAHEHRLMTGPVISDQDVRDALRRIGYELDDLTHAIVHDLEDYELGEGRHEVES